jgi:DNA primase small subunit
MARKEIVDYALGTGLDTQFHGLEKRSRQKSRVIAGPDLHDTGWRGKIARGTYELLLTASPEELEKAGLKKRVIETIIQHKEKLLESWKGKGPWGVIKDIGPENWKKIAKYSVERQSVKIDTVVTTDTHRLIRLTDTLHGKTGMKKIDVPLIDIEQFDPLKSAVTFEKGRATVLVSDAPEFRLGEETYGPYKRQEINLPTAAALMLLCKGAAKMVE